MYFLLAIVIFPKWCYTQSIPRKEGFLCQNSWGENWGNKGRFILPYSIPLAEAKGFADADNNMNIIVPKVNKVVDTTCKKLDRILQLLNFR